MGRIAHTSWRVLQIYQGPAPSCITCHSSYIVSLMDEPPSKIIALILLLCVSALFSATETAFTSLSLYQLRKLKAQGVRGKWVYKLAHNPNLLLTTILAGNNLVNIAASAIATALAIALWGNYAIGYATGVLTLVVLIFAEITPKQIAIARNEQIAIFMAPVIRLLSIVCFPLIKVIGWISNGLTRIIIGKNNQKSVSLESLVHFMGEAKDQGVLEAHESAIMQGALRFNETHVRGVMTHRTNVFSVSAEQTLKEASPEILASKYSRIPVYKEDNEEHIVGILLMKKLLEHLSQGKDELKVEQIMEKPLFLSENKTLREALVLCRAAHINMGIVLDEFGGLAGVVTVEDIIEEFFGEMYDEHETFKSARIIPTLPGIFVVAGDITVGEFSDYFSLAIDADKYINTLGGFLVEKLDHIPTKGERVELPWGICEVEAVKENRITSFRFIPTAEED